MANERFFLLVKTPPLNFLLIFQGHKCSTPKKIESLPFPPSDLNNDWSLRFQDSVWVRIIIVMMFLLALLVLNWTCVLKACIAPGIR